MEETEDQLHARHRREQKDLQGRITSKKKNANKKTRKGVNDECAELERQLLEKQAEELRRLSGETDDVNDDDDDDDGAVLLTEGNQHEENLDGVEAGSTGAINGVASQLEKSSLADTSSTVATSAPQQTAEATAAGGPKKRNRQKERLARRAAEAEAATEAAKAEAANMSDSRGGERSRMAKVLTQHGLSEHAIRPDGHCMFSAVVDQLAQQGIPAEEGLSEQDRRKVDGEEAAPYQIVRLAAARYIESHREDFEGFLEAPLEEHVQAIERTAAWGSQTELVALANAYRIPINVVQDGATIKTEPSGGQSREGKEMWLAFYVHEYSLGPHYNSLRKAKE